MVKRESLTDRVYCMHCGSRLYPTDSVCRHCGAASPIAATVPADTVPNEAEMTPEMAKLARELSKALEPRIQVLRPFGQGGMGVVFLGRDPGLKRLVVIKVLAPDLAHDQSLRARFSREAQAAAAVSHPNVVSIYEVGQLPRSKTSYFVMQFVDGPTLAQEVPPGHAIPELKARRWIGEIASALAAAHSRGLIHRDVKLSNIMLERETGRAVVLDFGISAALTPVTLVSDKLTQQGTTIGTPQYMSPEQAAGGTLNDRSDVYSLGVVAFELVTGRLPFHEDNAMAIVAAHMLSTAPKVQSLRPDIDPAFGALIDKCLSKDPAARPAAAEIAKALLPDTHPIIEWPPPGLDRLQGAARRLLATSDLIVFVGLAFFISLALQPRLAAGLWLFLASMGVAGFIALFVAVTLRAAWLGGQLRWARRSGYPLDVLADVALDRPDDGSALINGLGIFATIPEAARKRALAFRRWAALASVASLVAAAALPTMWVLGIVGSRMVAGALLSLGEALLLFAPSLLLLAVQALLLEPERRIRRRLRRPREEILLKEAPPIRREVVNVWLQAAEVQPPPAPGPVQTYLIKELVAIPIIPLLVLLVTFGLVSVMVIFTWDLATAREERDRWAAEVARLPGWRTLDSLLTISATAPRRALRPDTVIALRLVRDLPADAPDDSVPLDAERIWDAWRAFPGTLPDTVRIMLANDTLHPGLGRWRFLATSPELPPLWYVPANLAGFEDPAEVGVRSLTALSVYAMRNVAAAALALNDGDQPSAMTRAREILSVGRHLVRDPVPATHQRGLSILGIGSRTMVQIALVTGDPVIGREAAEIQDAVDRRRAELGLFANRSLGLAMATPDSAMIALAADTTRAPSDRWALLSGIAIGFCWNGKEILLGAAPERGVQLQAAAGYAADISRTADWVDLNARMMQRHTDVGGAGVLGAPSRAALCESMRR
jgi:hypothetical protein